MQRKASQRHLSKRELDSNQSLGIDGVRQRSEVPVSMLTREQIADLAGRFSTVDENGCGTIPVADVQEALKIAGIDLPGFQFRELMKRYGSAKDLAFDDFQNLFIELRSEKDHEVNKWKQRIGSVTGAYTVKGLSEQSNEEIVHTIRVESHQQKHLNTYTKLENLTLALMSAQAIGCNIVNIDGDDLSKGKPHLVLGLLWQIIRIGLFNQIDLRHVPGLFRLLQESETLDDLRKLSPEQILIRWVNYHLAKAGVDRKLTNFTTDIIDSEIYTYLLNEIAPKAANVSLNPLSVKSSAGYQSSDGNIQRAGAMLNEAEKIDCREFVAPNDVAQGNYKLNLAFVANLFNKYPGLPEPGTDEFEIDAIDETREEKTYRNWMNSMGVDPHVNWLYSDLCSGVIIFQLGKQLRFSLVGIQGKDIYDGNQTLTLALVWQLMRAYTLTVLAQCTQSGDSLATDKEIIAWVNNKLASSGRKRFIKSFQDQTISDACVVLDLIESIKPGTISYALVKTGTAEVKPRMVMTVFACLMARDYMPNVKEISSPVEPLENHR
ncbi:Plsi protein [Dirofilaria immitis]|nr:Plsi protein [Dirofilaria immitis]